MDRTSATLSLAMLMTLLAACGGGGGDGGTPAPVASAEFTSANAPVIASAVVSAVSTSQLIGDLGGLAAPTPAATGSVNVADVEVGVPPALEVTLEPAAEPCAVAGTVSVAAQIANPGTLTVGDSISLTFADCDQGDGAILDGVFGFTVAAFAGDILTQSFEITITVTLSDLQLVEAGESATMDGGFSLTLDTTNAAAMSITVAGSALSVASAGESASLENFAIVLTLDPLVGTSTLEIDGLVQTSAFTGRVELSTPSPLLIDGAGVPTAGEIVIEGARGATVTVRVISAQQIELLIDLDGNGTVDEVIPTTWEDLRD